MHRYTVPAVALVLVLGWAIEGRADNSPCAKWEIHGYRIGMTRAEVETVRATKPAGRLLSAAVRSELISEVRRINDSGREATLYFGTDGQLVSYVANMPLATDREGLVAALRARLGEPLQEDPYAKFIVANDASVQGTEQQTTWGDRACDSYIRLGTYHPIGIRPVTVVAVESIAHLEARDRVRTEKADKLLR